MSTTPIICLAKPEEPHRFTVAKVTADLRCISCGSGDLDLDEVTAAKMATTGVTVSEMDAAPSGAVVTIHLPESAFDTSGGGIPLSYRIFTKRDDGRWHQGTADVNGASAQQVLDAVDKAPAGTTIQMGDKVPGPFDNGGTLPGGTASAKTAGIDWQGDIHMGVPYVTGRAPNGDVYEIYHNPNSNPTPYSWVRYGPEGDTGPNSMLDVGRGFATAQEAFTAADAHFQSLGTTSSKVAFNDPPMDEVKDTSSVSQKVTCSSCLTEHVITAVDPAQPMPPCPSCGRDTLSPAGSTLAVRKTADAYQEAVRRGMMMGTSEFINPGAMLPSSVYVVMEPGPNGARPTDRKTTDRAEANRWAEELLARTDWSPYTSSLDAAGSAASRRTAERKVVDSVYGRYVEERKDGMEFRYYPDGSVTILDTSKRSGTNRTIGHTGPDPERIPPEFKTGSVSQRTAGWAIVSPSGTNLWGMVYDTEEGARAHFDEVKGMGSTSLAPNDVASYTVKQVDAEPNRTYDPSLGGNKFQPLGSLDARFAALADDVKRQFEQENPSSTEGCDICGDSGHTTAQHKADPVKYDDATRTALRRRVAAKVEQIADGVMATNPGMNRQAALAVAGKTLAAYPAMIEGN